MSGTARSTGAYAGSTAQPEAADRHPPRPAAPSLGDKSGAEIEQEAEATRANLADALHPLRERASPGQPFEQARDYVRTPGGSEFARNLGAAVRENPLPLLLISAGIAWLMLSGGGGRARGRAYGGPMIGAGIAWLMLSGGGGRAARGRSIARPREATRGAARPAATGFGRPDNRSAAEIEREVEAARANLADTLHPLRERASRLQLSGKARDRLGGGGAGRVGEVPTLAAALGDADTRVRWAAAEALGRMELADAAEDLGRMELAPALGDAAREVRHAVRDAARGLADEAKEAVGATTDEGGAGRGGPGQPSQGGPRGTDGGGSGGGGGPPERRDECHFHAEMPSQPELGRAARVEVTVALEKIERLPGPTSQQAAAKADPDKAITVQVLPRANCRVVGEEDDEDWARIPVPGPQTPARLVFHVRGIEAGAAEVWVEARQGAVTLTQLRLQPVFVPARATAAAMAAKAEVPSGAQAAGSIGVRTTVAFGAQAPVGRDHLVLRIFEVPCTKGRFQLHFNLDCRDPGINENMRTREFEFSRESYVADQYARLENAWIADGADYDQFMRRLRAHGMDMYDHLVPEKVRYVLWRHRAEIGAVQVVSEEPFIPWEIAYMTDPAARETDGEGFLGGLGLVRWLHNVPWPQAALQLRPGRVRFAVPDYPDPDWRLPGAAKEAAMLRRLFPGSQPVPAHSNAVEDLLGRGGDAFDVLHFACHGLAEDKKIWDAGLMMTGRVVETTTADGIEARYQPDPLEQAQVWANARLGSNSPRPLVFLNACQVGRTGRSLGGLGGFATAFLDPKSGQGAGLFVGTLWSVGDGSALTFAEAFYEGLLAGKTLATATRAARERAKAAREPTWLAYTVYGHPLARVVGDGPA